MDIPVVPADMLEYVSEQSILSEFQVDGHQLLVISLDDEKSCSSLLLQTETCVRLGDFEVQGKRCAIIKLLKEAQIPISDIANVLTKRELQIAALVATGYPNKQIATRLRISEWTVSTHLRRIFMKLGVESRAAMVYCCANALHQVSH